MIAPTDSQLWGLVAERRQGVLATIRRDGRPQPSSVLYLPETSTRSVRISTTADRLKARNLARDPRAALHVVGDDFWNYAVAEGTATLSAVATTPGDDACQALLRVHTAFYGIPEQDAFYRDMIAARRLIVHLHVDHLFGVMVRGGRMPAPPAGDRASGG